LDEKGMVQSRIIYLGIRGSVIALNSANGLQVWAKELKGSDFVNVVLDGGRLYATTHGEAFCLDPRNGDILWHNQLTGYGWGLASIAVEGMVQNPSLILEQKRRSDEQDAAAAAASVSS
jgi:outer membrane protein assembly factor BamB